MNTTARLFHESTLLQSTQRAIGKSSSHGIVRLTIILASVMFWACNDSDNRIDYSEALDQIDDEASRNRIVHFYLQHPEYDENIFAYAYMLEMDGQLDSAQLLYQSLSPSFRQREPGLSLALGRIAISNENYPSAFNYFLESRAVMCCLPGTNYYLGYTAEKLHQHELAVHYYNEELKTQPKDLPSLYNLGMLYYEIDMPDSSAKYLQRHIDITMDENAYVTLAYSLHRTGRSNEAFKIMEVIEAEYPRSTYSLLNCARMYLIAGRSVDSRRLLTTVLEQDSLNPLALELLAELNGGSN